MKTLTPDWPLPAATLPLDGLGLIRASGPDAQTFLQNQLTNDSKLLIPTQGQLSGYCSPKGRLLAVFTVLALSAEDYVLALPVALLAPTLKRLRMFVLRSKLVLSDASGELPALGLMGREAGAALARVGIAVPLGDYAVTAFDGGWALCRPGPLPRYELRATPEKLAALHSSLALPSAGAAHWALAEILAGMPQVLAETSEQFVPQTINLDTAGGVSFTKGCYPGQEIVARVHYLGRIKQRLRLAESSLLLAPGTTLLDAQQRSVGTVMASAWQMDGRAALSLSLNVSHGETDLQTADGAALVTPLAAD